MDGMTIGERKGDVVGMAIGCNIGDRHAPVRVELAVIVPTGVSMRCSPTVMRPEVMPNWRLTRWCRNHTSPNTPHY
jgi:hypothetical protein